MKPSLISVRHNDETILTISDQAFADKFIKCLLTFDSEITDVTVILNNQTKRKTKRFVLSKTEGMNLNTLGLDFMFPKNTVIYVFKK